jgi:Domain of unknown function (DUF4902)
MLMPTFSPDGYIRLSLTKLSMLPFIHLASDNDLDFLAELKEQTVPAKAAGFSEWKSDTNPAISIGWGWFIHNKSDHIYLAPDGVRSNVMLTDVYGYDLGQKTTSNLFDTWLSLFDWQNTVNDALHTPSPSPVNFNIY